jgi:hypothetical protein
MIKPSPNNPRKGTVAVFTAISLTVVLMVVAVAVDAGMLFAEKRHAQAVADSAALAGAADLYKRYGTNGGQDPSGTAVASAKAIAADNGYADDGTTSVVDVRAYNATYLGGPKAGQTIGLGYIEVTVTYNHPRYFSLIFGSSAIPIKARAVAFGSRVLPKWGLLLLDPTTTKAVNLNGTGVILDVGDGVIQANTSGNPSMDAGNGQVLAKEVQVATASGSITNVGNIVTTPDAGNIDYNVPPTPDPLAHLPQPTASSFTDGEIVKYQNAVDNKGNISNQVDDTNVITVLTDLLAKSVPVGTVYVLKPGVYGGSVKLPTFTNSDVVIFHQSSSGNGGIYFLENGISANNASLIMYPTDTGGMMFYNNGTGSNDKISLAGGDNGVVSLSGLTGGTYEGMMIFQNRTATQEISVSGKGDFNMTGTIYAASAGIGITGHGGTYTVGSAVVTKTATISGNGTIIIDFTEGKITPQRQLRLVE